jgi:hypothetical protein
MLIGIVRTLPPERALELVDFARFLQSQATRPSREMDETEELERSGEDKWGQLLAKPEAQRALIEMAREARQDYEAGRTTDITTTDDDRLAPA